MSKVYLVVGQRTSGNDPCSLSCVFPLYNEAVETNVGQASRFNSGINKGICMGINNMAWLVPTRLSIHAMWMSPM